VKDLRGQLLASAIQTKTLGGRAIQVVICRSRSPRNWYRVRVLNGLYGRVCGRIEPGQYLVDLWADDVISALGGRS
jgi:hypothetical protein